MVWLFDYIISKYSLYGNISRGTRFSYRRNEELSTVTMDNDFVRIEWYQFQENGEIMISENVEYKTAEVGVGKYVCKNYPSFDYTENNIDDLMNLIFKDRKPTFIKNEIKATVNVKTPEKKQKSLFNTAVLKSQVVIQTAVPNGKKKKLF